MESLAVDTCFARSLRNIATLLLEQVRNVGRFQMPYPALLGLFQGQLARSGSRRRLASMPSRCPQMRWQLGKRDHLAFGEGARALNHVLKFAHVARPGIGFECDHYLRFKSFNCRL